MKMLITLGAGLLITAATELVTDRADYWAQLAACFAHLGRYAMRWQLSAINSGVIGWSP